MAIYQTLCTSFKAEVARGMHNFTRTTGNVFKLALYTALANLGADTASYTTEGEASGTNYTAGGAVLTNITPVSANTTGYWSFDNITFSNVTLTCHGALIYNTTGNHAVCVLNFGTSITKTASDLVITFPPMGSSDAILRIT